MVKDLIITPFGPYYILGYVDTTSVNCAGLSEPTVTINRKELAIIIDIGTVKLANIICKFNGKTFQNCFAFDNQENADQALEHLRNMLIINKVSGKKNRPNY